MAWRPARAWTSQRPVAGYRHFELITQAGVVRCDGLSWQLCLLRRIASGCSGVSSRIQPAGAAAGSPFQRAMRILHLSDPHLVAADQGLVRGRPALAHFERALQLGGALNPDLMLVTGDLCQDESWGGNARLLLDLTPDGAVQHRVLR